MFKNDTSKPISYLFNNSGALQNIRVEGRGGVIVFVGVLGGPMSWEVHTIDCKQKVMLPL